MNEVQMQSYLDTPGFAALMNRLARAWSEQDTEGGVACFTEDAVYMEPPDIQLFVGHDQLRPYFAALTPGTFMRFHHIWFDEEQQIGTGEYTFGSEGDPVADHGIAVAEVRDGRIARWREYQRKGPFKFSDFTAVEGKEWEWHIGNYP